MTQAPLTREQIQEQNTRGINPILDAAGALLQEYLFGVPSQQTIDSVNKNLPEAIRVTPDASTTPSDVPNVIKGGNSRATTGAATMGPDAPPPRQPDLSNLNNELIGKLLDPDFRKRILQDQYEAIKQRDADIARYRLEGQQEVTRRQAQNNVISAWKEVEVATIQKERDMALGLAEIAYRSSMPNPAVMQQLNAASQIGVSAFGNRPLPVQ